MFLPRKAARSMVWSPVAAAVKAGTGWFNSTMSSPWPRTRADFENRKGCECWRSGVAQRLDHGVQVAVVAEHHEFVAQAGEMGVRWDVDDHIEIEHLGACVRRTVGAGFQILNVNVHAREETCDFVNDPRVIQGHYVYIIGIGTLGLARAGVLHHGGEVEPSRQVRN